MSELIKEPLKHVDWNAAREFDNIQKPFAEYGQVNKLSIVLLFANLVRSKNFKKNSSEKYWAPKKKAV